MFIIFTGVEDPALIGLAGRLWRWGTEGIEVIGAAFQCLIRIIDPLADVGEITGFPGFF